MKDIVTQLGPVGIYLPHEHVTRAYRIAHDLYTMKGIDHSLTRYFKLLRLKSSNTHTTMHTAGAHHITAHVLSSESNLVSIDLAVQMTHLTLKN